MFGQREEPMSRSVAVFTVIAALSSVTSLEAQRVRFGVAAGTSWIGGGDSRVLVDAGGFNVTGASQAGHHLRGFAEWPLGSGGLAFRAELLQLPAFTAQHVGDRG